ncbi:MAG: glutathione S-transferase family protein [Ideonella sp.]|jgi:glutathione S-transferase|nr:glutathione S-transferase family protein [Ideonella sp.]
MQLIIGNKNYSSWSLRPWLLMTELGIPFDEIRVRFDGFGPDSQFKRTMRRYAPTGAVPVLVDDDGFAIWDSLAIVETLAERFPDRGVWPAEARARARARTLCAEMHAGFSALRRAFPVNLEASLPEVGARVLASEPAVSADVVRLVDMWIGQLEVSGGPMLFGDFCAADAFYAPVCTRLRTYGVPVPATVAAYIDRVYARPGMQRWVAEALAERDFLPFEEPYRTAPDPAP